MDGNNKHTSHNDNDIIIRDQDGSFKILREGKFVPLDDAAPAAKPADLGPKREFTAAPDSAPAPVRPAMTPTPAPASAPVRPTMPAPTRPMPPAPVRASAPAPVKPAAPAAPASPAMPTQPPVRGMADQELLAQADTFIGKSGVSFASGELRGRVAKALVSHIKQVRKPFETRQLLAKPVAEGGAGLTESDINAIMAAAGEKNGSAANGGVKPITKPENPMVKPMNNSMVAIGKEITTPARVALNTMSNDAPYFPVSKEEGKKAFSLPSVSAARPVLMDVQKPSRAIGGPIDELGYDLLTWRRLAPNPKDRSKKIEAQLDLLEQDGFMQRQRGYQSWRASEVVKAYLLAAKQSLENGQPLPQLLGNGGNNQLSWDEWQSVAELNERLMA